MMDGFKRSASIALPFFQTATLGGNLNATVLRREWFFNTRRDIMAGAVVGLALIPEAIAFSIGSPELMVISLSNQKSKLIRDS